MWDAGLAHRDIKPSNVMVSEGEVVLIDFSFGMVRPTPWRQAVDLANMMLLLALSSDVATVYERALRQFAPTDIAEAFAATRSVTIPRQTRSLLAALKRDRGLDLVKEFQDITPEREPIAIQRWSARRLWRTAAAASAAAFLLAQVWAQIRGRGLL
jgi:serine/threonine protein kinase